MDLDNLAESKVHYMGMFTFCKKESEQNVYEVVDGQQRITTLIILINEILSRIEGGIPKGKSVDEYKKQYLYEKPYGEITLNYKFKYVDQPSDACFKSEILGQREMSDSLQPKTLYTKNLTFAKQYFAEKIKDFGQDKLVISFEKITERLKFSVYQIDDIDDVYVTFETMNNRGKELSTLELLKNRLIYLSTIYSRDKDQEKNVKTLRNNINEAWKTIYCYLGKNSKKTLNDDTFLKDHWIMYFKYDRSVSKVFRKYLLCDYFTTKKVFEGGLPIDKVNKYVLSLKDSIFAWFSMNCPNESDALDKESKIWLIRLNHVGLGCFRPLLMSAYLKNYSHKTDLVKACERYRFLVINVSERRSNTNDSCFYRLAHEYYSDNNKEDLTKVVSEKTTEWTQIRNFVDNAKDRYEHRQGFYSWRGIRYFLYEYEKWLQNNRNIKVNWEIFEQNQGDKISIEHVFPQKSTDTYWKDRFKNENLLHSLGNLLLLSKSKNSELQNDSFDKKKKTVHSETGRIVYDGYDEGSYSELEVAKEAEWNPESIEKRGRRLIKFLKEHWDLEDEFTEDDIEKLLNLSGK